MDYSQLSDFEINCMVAKECGFSSKCFAHDLHSGAWNPCENASDAWPIIAEHKISIIKDSGLYLWVATSDAYWVDGCEWHISQEVMDENPLRAAMIVFLMMQDAKHA
ncbi:phage protein NinX family protein [Enterobacter roggenkampii]|uniref:phage protein NinX family protein n=1 Tax=Enterobacter roggenkampii TaxID=1812935 RepID=UPI00254CD890|nr:phage protein NinX family protein [Enterobacter roggenkampii]MDL0009633.1 DUF2591 domain-containing protein [Enterobacter roggenkampii]MED5760044.1 phage protein NinX family protein [Enterobacter roggenkampii]